MSEFKEQFSTNKFSVILDKRELNNFDFINLPFTYGNEIIGITTKVEDLGEKVDVEITLFKSIISQIVNLNDSMTPDSLYLRIGEKEE